MPAQPPPDAAVHTLFVQVLPAEQVPQLSVAEQPSLMAPQFLASDAQVAGVQAATHWDDALQTFGDVQVPHEPPQPLEPQVLPVQFGVQLATQWFEESHVLPPVHAGPQLTRPPQPSGWVPQTEPV